MKRFHIAPLLLALGVAGAACDTTSSPSPATPPGVVLFIGDGMGEASVEAARLTGRTLAMRSLPIRGLVTTASASDSITDSGAAATALATGVATYNGAVGVGPDGRPVETVLEAAEARGWATGLVATSSVTHATPAAFAAHVADRYMEADIAAQMTESGVDVLLGGGRVHFSAAGRPDGRDLLGALEGRGCTVVSALPFPDPSGPCLVGLLAEEALPAAGDRAVTLADLTDIALDAVIDDPEGFFLMVEGSQIDWAGHANDGPALVAEVIDLDDAVARALARLGDRPNTAVVVTADHETGGLSVSQVAGATVFAWGTTGHTSAPVPVFARGDGLDELAGTLANTRLGALLLARVRR